MTGMARVKELPYRKDSEWEVDGRGHWMAWIEDRLPMRPQSVILIHAWPRNGKDDETPPVVSLKQETRYAVFTPEGARELAEALREAADRVEVLRNAESM